MDERFVVYVVVGKTIEFSLTSREHAIYLGHTASAAGELFTVTVMHRWGKFKEDTTAAIRSEGGNDAYVEGDEPRVVHGVFNPEGRLVYVHPVFSTALDHWMERAMQGKYGAMLDIHEMQRFNERTLRNAKLFVAGPPQDVDDSVGDGRLVAGMWQGKLIWIRGADKCLPLYVTSVDNTTLGVSSTRTFAELRGHDSTKNGYAFKVTTVHQWGIIPQYDGEEFKSQELETYYPHPACACPQLFGVFDTASNLLFMHRTKRDVGKYWVQHVRQGGHGTLAMFNVTDEAWIDGVFTDEAITLVETVMAQPRQIGERSEKGWFVAVARNGKLTWALKRKRERHLLPAGTRIGHTRRVGRERQVSRVGRAGHLNWVKQASKPAPDLPVDGGGNDVDALVRSYLEPQDLTSLAQVNVHQQGQLGKVRCSALTGHGGLCTRRSVWLGNLCACEQHMRQWFFHAVRVALRNKGTFDAKFVNMEDRPFTVPRTRLSVRIARAWLLHPQEDEPGREDEMELQYMDVMATDQMNVKDGWVWYNNRMPIFQLENLGKPQSLLRLRRPTAGEVRKIFGKTLVTSEYYIPERPRACTVLLNLNDDDGNIPREAWNYVRMGGDELSLLGTRTQHNWVTINANAEQKGLEEPPVGHDPEVPAADDEDEDPAYMSPERPRQLPVHRPHAAHVEQIQRSHEARRNDPERAAALVESRAADALGMPVPLYRQRLAIVEEEKAQRHADQEVLLAGDEAMARDLAEEFEDHDNDAAPEEPLGVLEELE
jgi:hypothetical protein